MAAGAHGAGLELIMHRPGSGVGGAMVKGPRRNAGVTGLATHRDATLAGANRPSHGALAGAVAGGAGGMQGHALGRGCHGMATGAEDIDHKLVVHRGGGVVSGTVGHGAIAGAVMAGRAAAAGLAADGVDHHRQGAGVAAQAVCLMDAIDDTAGVMAGHAADIRRYL